MAPSDRKAAKYVYGVARAAEAKAQKDGGIEGGAVGVVTLDGLAALTGDVADEVLEAGRDELMAHARVLERALADGAVLPMRFGVVMPDEEAVRMQLLGAYGDDLEVQLTEMGDKVEVNIKGIRDEDAVLREVVAENPEVANLREEIQSKPADATYYERIRLGELVAAALDSKREQEGPAIVDRLLPHAVAVEIGEAVHERMAVNASFLVRRSGLEDFDRAVDELGEELAGRIRLRYTGPLPPHSFVELGLEAA